MTTTAKDLIAAPETVQAVAGAVCSILATLDESQRAKAAFPFTDEAERRDWAYFPREFHGLPRSEMTGSQQSLIERLLEAALGINAQAKAGTIMALESVLGRMEKHESFVRDPGRYYLSIFGEPGNDVWGIRFEGHHVSINYTVRGGFLAPTPIFLGSNPAEISHGGHVILRALAEEEDCARELLQSLQPAQRVRAIICETAPGDLVLRNAPRILETVTPGDIKVPALFRIANETLPEALRPSVRYERGRPAGLPAAALSDHQRDLLLGLLRVYFRRLPDEAAVAAEASLMAAGLDEVHFAWAGESEPHQPHYYRVQGPALLIEYDKTQDNANHIHSVWRDPEGDFGEDLLRRHLIEMH